MRYGSDVVLGQVGVVVANSHLSKVVLIGLSIGGRRRSLQVCTVPRSELVLAGFTEGRCDVTLRVVSPYLTNVEVLDEDDWVATPELLSWDQAARGDDGARCDLGTLLDASTFKNDRLVTDRDIILDGARVERAAITNLAVVADEYFGGHAGW